MAKLQIYITDDLYARIIESVRRKGTTVSTEIMQVLEREYPDEGSACDVSFTELLNTIKDEVLVFLEENRDLEYTLYDMSETFKEIDMAENDRLTALKPRLGKAFRALVDNGKIPGLVPVYSHGRQKRRYNAALYRYED